MYIMRHESPYARGYLNKCKIHGIRFHEYIFFFWFYIFLTYITDTKINVANLHAIYMS